MPRFQSQGVTLHTTDLNGAAIINIGGMTDMSIATGTDTTADDSGAIYDELRAIFSQVPDIMLRSKSLTTWLTYVGLGGYCILADGSHPGLRCYGAALSDCKAALSAGVNLRYTIAKGLIVLGQLNMPRGRDAELTLGVHPITDGTNAPISGTYTSITLPTGLASQQFTLGLSKVAGVVLSDVADAQLNFGVQISAKTPMLGGVWPDSVAVREVQPLLAFTNFDPRVLDNSVIPLLGIQASHANTKIQLKKRANYSTFVADGTAQHISFTMNGLAYVTDAFRGAGNSEAQSALCVQGVHDGTYVPIVFNLADTYNPALS